jgi:uncharacterized membrane protein YukC
MNTMAEPQTNLVTFEADLFGTLFAFQKKIMTLLRESSLNDEKIKTVGDRIKKQLDDAIAETKGLKQPFNVAERLDAAYEEAKRLVDELSVSQDSTKATPKKSRKNKP